MSIYIGNDLEDRLEILETENDLLKKRIAFNQVVNEIDNMAELHVDSSFYKKAMKMDSNSKIIEWINSSIGHSTVIQHLTAKRPKLSNLNQTQNRRRYINFENGSHFLCSLNLNKPQSTVFIVFRLHDIASGNQEFVNSLIGNTNEEINSKHITFYRTYSGLGLLISKASGGSYVSIANDGSSLIPKPDITFPSSKSNCTDLNKWHVISVTWSGELSTCWSNGEKLITFTTGKVKGSDCCFIGDFGKIPGLNKTHLTGAIREIIAIHRTLKDEETLYIHQYLMSKWGIADKIIF